MSTPNHPATPASPPVGKPPHRVPAPLMDALACLRYLQDARTQSAWGEYLVQPATENILLADVLQELGYRVRAVRWKYVVDTPNGLHSDVCLAVELAPGEVVEVRSGVQGFEAIERHTAQRHDVTWSGSLLDLGLAELELAGRIRGIGQPADDAYERQRERVLALLRPVIILEEATPVPVGPRTTPRL